ncbi:hypothetical protein V9T40_010202 [Parthenolecanium corni]|uniref:Uncharacterized protein n=1 Tax=Parthenolecanium corni TaxID=536013 RepID=A0AAN9TAP7_9HEMI
MALRSEFIEENASQQNYIAKCRRLFSSKQGSNEATINLINDLIWNRDFCENVTINSSEFSGIDTFHTPQMLPTPQPRIRHARASKPGSGESGTNLNRRSSSSISNGPDPVIIEPTIRRRFYHNVWRVLKNTFEGFTGSPRISHQISVIENVPLNTVSNLVKMIFLPILLIVIALAMVPSIKELAKQTFYSIFYNAKVPDSRIPSLKRISVGISLIFEHLVKKMFPVVRLRWMNRKLFKRREKILAPIPPAVPS